MSIERSMTKIKNNKVIFSNAILIFYENLRTSQNSEWIDKYFEILSDPSNFNAEKYNIHHIRAVATFKDENHKNRKEALKLANEFEGNLIKLSYYNHIIAHYYLWKIFNDWDSKKAIQRLSNIENIEIFTNDEIMKIAKIKEECKKKNVTKEHIRERNKKWQLANLDKVRESCLKWNRSENGKKSHAKSKKKWRSQKCYDPLNKDYCSLDALQKRKRKYKEKYENINPSKCILSKEELGEL